MRSHRHRAVRKPAMAGKPQNTVHGKRARRAARNRERYPNKGLCLFAVVRALGGRSGRIPGWEGGCKFRPPWARLFSLRLELISPGSAGAGLAPARLMLLCPHYCVSLPEWEKREIHFLYGDTHKGICRKKITADGRPTRSACNFLPIVLQY
jgi:hypothetical protein